MGLFILGVFVGGIIGVTIMALCITSSDEPPAPRKEVVAGEKTNL